jgi:preprotein translocase subunit SecD
MNRYPVWKYAIILVAVLVGIFYTLPNFFGEAPAVQVSPAKATVKVDTATQARVQEVLKAAGIEPDAITFEGSSIKARFSSTDTQLKAKDAIQKALIPDPADPPYIVALNLLSRTPPWLASLHAAPMYLGLDLRGGVHFMLQVDMQAALTKKAESLSGDLRSVAAREERPPWRHQPGRADHRDPLPRHGHAGVRAAHPGRPVRRTAGSRRTGWHGFQAYRQHQAALGAPIQEQALKQNMVTLHNRINELGVAEPVIQQQGLDRIVVQLPGVQDTAKAKDILGRTATLEVRLVDESAEARAAESGTGPVPFGSERYLERNSQPVIVKKQVILTGENLTDAQPGFDNQTQEAAVHLSLDAKGSRIFRDITRENIGKRMAILLFEKGKGEVVTAPVIRSEIAGGRVQISGLA